MTTIERAISILNGGRRREFTTQIHLRLPDDVYAALASEGERGGVSLNGLVVEILREALREQRSQISVTT